MKQHVIVGAGQVGTRLAALLVEQGHSVRLVSRTGNSIPGVEGVSADASQRAGLRDATRGADVIYNCINPPYHLWERDWPAMNTNLIAAAEETGAVLVTLSNLYGYGAVDGPMTENTPLTAHTRKGRVRARMWEETLAAHREGRIRATEVRASDYIGESSDQTNFGVRIFPRMLAGKPIMLMGRTDQPHTWTYTGDAATLLALVGQDERAWGQAWHVPSCAPQTQAEVIAALADGAGVPMPKIRTAGAGMLRMVGLFNKPAGELVEMLYEFDRPFVMDSSLTERTFGVEPTPWDEIIAETLRVNGVDTVPTTGV
ncbi:MAG: NAD-dependent epimerase/dehydratase family protein [Actinobacteria bacterium]|nr:NAD-dependent epimerase/dehydratase family protein [Actinomycetota bacterium]